MDMSSSATIPYCFSTRNWGHRFYLKPKSSSNSCMGTDAFKRLMHKSHFRRRLIAQHHVHVKVWKGLMGFWVSAF